MSNYSHKSYCCGAAATTTAGKEGVGFTKAAHGQLGKDCHSFAAACRNHLERKNNEANENNENSCFQNIPALYIVSAT
jgi:hypothetical protein